MCGPCGLAAAAALSGVTSAKIEVLVAAWMKPIALGWGIEGY
jgi:hypothetical protein